MMVHKDIKITSPLIARYVNTGESEKIFSALSKEGGGISFNKAGKVFDVTTYTTVVSDSWEHKHVVLLDSFDKEIGKRVIIAIEMYFNILKNELPIQHALAEFIRHSIQLEKYWFIGRIERFHVDAYVYEPGSGWGLEVSQTTAVINEVVDFLHFVFSEPHNGLCGWLKIRVLRSGKVYLDSRHITIDSSGKCMDVGWSEHAFDIPTKDLLEILLRDISLLEGVGDGFKLLVDMNCHD